MLVTPSTMLNKPPPTGMSLLEITDNVKLAREYALLGSYSSAAVCYQGVLEQIRKYLLSVRDSSVQQKWQQVNSSSFSCHRSEIIHVKLMEELSLLERENEQSGIPVLL